jgi:hypothetical protein
MSSALAQAPEALPNPPTFKPKNNPAFILHGALKTSYEEVGAARVSQLQLFVWTLTNLMRSCLSLMLDPTRSSLR